MTQEKSLSKRSNLVVVCSENGETHGKSGGTPKPIALISMLLCVFLHGRFCGFFGFLGETTVVVSIHNSWLWLVVEPTHLKNISQIGFHFPRDRDENSKQIFELPPPSDLFFGIIFLSVSAVCLGELFGDDTNIPFHPGFELSKYTLENYNGSPKWRFGRWCSFLLGDFLGSMLIFRDVRMDMNWKKNKKRKFLPVCQWFITLKS